MGSVLNTTPGTKRSKERPNRRGSFIRNRVESPFMCLGSIHRLNAQIGSTTGGGLGGWPQGVEERLWIERRRVDVARAARLGSFVVKGGGCGGTIARFSGRRRFPSMATIGSAPGQTLHAQIRFRFRRRRLGIRIGPRAHRNSARSRRGALRETVSPGSG